MPSAWRFTGGSEPPDGRRMGVAMWWTSGIGENRGLVFGASMTRASGAFPPLSEMRLLWLAGGLVALALAAWLLARVSIAWVDARLIAPLSRCIIAVLWVAPLGALYLGVGVVIERIRMSHDPPLLALVTLALAALTALIYTPLRVGIQRFISATLYHDYYQFGETVQRFSQELATLHTQPEIARYLLEQLSATLNLSGMAFVALPDGLDHSLLRVIEGDDLRAYQDYATPSGRAAILAGLRALDVDHLRAHVTAPRWEPLVMNPWPGCAALSLVGLGPADAAVQALLIIGAKRARNPLRRQDRALLRTVASQAAVALINAQLVGGLRISLAQTQVASAQLATARAEQQLLLREVVGANDRQRAALARDLHDDALQDVLYVTRHTRVCARLAEEAEAQMQAVAQSLARPSADSLTAAPSSSAARLSATVSSSATTSATTSVATPARQAPTAPTPPLAPPPPDADAQPAANVRAPVPDAQARVLTEQALTAQIMAAAQTLRRLRIEGAYVTERSPQVERKLRALCLGLHPEALHSLGLVAALDDLVERIQEETAGALSVSTYFDAPATAIAERLAPQAALSLYRITQEALRNTAKHGDATAVALRLTTAPDTTDARAVAAASADNATNLNAAAYPPRTLILEVCDDGRGMPLPVDYGRLLREGHLGLAGMRERAESLGGRLRFQRMGANGCALTLALPLTPHIVQPSVGAPTNADEMASPTPVASRSALLPPNRGFVPYTEVTRADRVWTRRAISPTHHA